MSEEMHDAGRKLVALVNSIGPKNREKTLSNILSYIIGETKIPKSEKLVALTQITATIETDVCEQLDLLLAMRKENEITKEELNQKLEELTNHYYNCWLNNYKNL